MAEFEMKKRLPVFISSTSDDLVPYRKAAQQVVDKLEQSIKGMEFFGTKPDAPLQVCLNAIGESKIFISIIGMRYGSIEETHNKSFTELEYEEAVRLKIPTLIYIMGEDCPVLSKYVDTGEGAARLENFKKLLRNRHTVSFFSSPEDFSNKLTMDLLSVLDSIGHADEADGIRKSMLNIQKAFQQTFLHFLFRPMKHLNQEGTLKIKVTDRPKSCYTLKTSVTTELKMMHGDAVCVPVHVLDCEKNTYLTENMLYLYGEKQSGDWIETVKPNTIVNVKVKLNYILSPEYRTYDTGSVIEKVGYRNLILVEPPSGKY